VKVLISAFVCGPGAGSEPGAAWAWAAAAAQRHDVWLVTDHRSEPKVSAELARRPVSRLHPVYIRTPLFPGREFGKTDRARYVLWQLALPKTIRLLHAAVDFDVVHHLTLAADWLPAGTSRLDDVPFVWGPVGGCAPIVPRLWMREGVALAAGELARLLVTGSCRTVIGERIARRADLVVAQNSDVADRYRPFADVIVEPHIALDSDELAAARAAPEGFGAPGRRRAVFVGRLLPWKGLCLAIEALRRPEAQDWDLHVIGEGSDRARAQRLVKRWRLSGRVHFEGLLPRPSVLRRLATADVLLFPSMHDAAGWIVAEALSLGCPVVCLDVAGPGELVAAGDGVKVPPRGDVVLGLAQGLASIRSRIAPRPRWGADRSADVIDAWYERAVKTSQAAGAAAPDGWPRQA
jgi:glycosyltransferase involved in cell wall biosynthesis